MPFGPAVKQTLKTATDLGLSSRSHNDAYKLIGRKFDLPVIGANAEVVDLMKNRKGGTYTMVVKSEDGARHEIPMSEDYFQLLMSSAGSKEAVDSFKLNNPISRDAQASKGLTIRETKRANTADVTHTQLKGIEASNVDKIKEMSPTLMQDYVYFKSAADLAPVYLPRVYAERLIKMGAGRIVEGGPK